MSFRHKFGQNLFSDFIVMSLFVVVAVVIAIDGRLGLS